MVLSDDKYVNFSLITSEGYNLECPDEPKQDFQNLTQEEAW